MNTILNILNKILLLLYKIRIRYESLVLPYLRTISDFSYSFPWGRSSTSAPHQYFSDKNITYIGSEYHLLTKKEHVVDNDWWNSDKIEFEYTTGMLFSTEKFLYGSFEAEIYIPRGYGMWTAFWLFGANDERFCEIDIFEYYGTQHKFTYNTHAGKDYQHNLYGKNNGIKLESLENSWHTYRLDWTKKYLYFYIDNVLVGIRSAKHIDLPMNLIIGSGIEEKNLDLVNQDLPTTMKIKNIIYCDLSYILN